MATNGTQDDGPSQADAVDHSKVKAEQKKKAELMREIHKLDVQIQAMERERTTHIFSKRSDFRKEFVTLEEMDTKLLDERKDERVQMQQQLSKLSHMVKRFQRELTNIKPTPEFVERLKIIMEEIEGAINSFKQEQKQKYEELMRGEQTIQQELQALERKFEAWAHTGSDPSLSHRSGTTSHKPLASARDITKDLPPEVAAFEKFLLQTGGHRGGWDEYDHGTFLKFRNRYKGRIVFLDHLKGSIPTKTEDEIREHETWYQEYLFLQERKKDSIKEWREKKEEEKEDILSKAQEGDAEGVVEDQEELERRQRLQEKIEEEKRARFSKLNSWKVQKELEKAITEERKMREDLMKAKKQEDERKRQAEIRAQVEEFRKQREEEEAMIKEHEELRKRQEEECRRQESAREIIKFRHRDQDRLAEKLAKEREKENMQKEKERKMERWKSQMEPEVARDPSRLLKPTAGWKARLKDKSTSGGQILHMPHSLQHQEFRATVIYLDALTSIKIDSCGSEQAIPNWRKQ